MLLSHHLIMPLASSPTPLSSGLWLFTKICCNEEVITVANTAGRAFKGEGAVPAGAPECIAGGGGEVFQTHDAAAASRSNVSHLWATTASSVNRRSGVTENSLFFCFDTAGGEKKKKEPVIVCHWPLQRPIGAAAPQQTLVFFVIRKVVYCQVGNQYF